MESMTGHGRGAATLEGWRCTVECASVNRKGLEVAVALPRSTSTATGALENRIREAVQKTVRRGRINVAVNLEPVAAQGDKRNIIDQQAARRALKDLKDIRQQLSLPGEITLDLLLRSPGVLRNPAEDIPGAEKLWPAMQAALKQAVERMRAMRLREGAHLVSDLLKRLRLLETAATAIKARVPAVMRRRREQMFVRLEELGVTAARNDQAVARELSIIAERSDITEELTRLESHFVQFREALSGVEPAGRTLDYLAQEMFREINTLGNKAADATISRRVVQSKAELDRIREQVANLE